MNNMHIVSLPVAERVWAVPDKPTKESNKKAEGFRSQPFAQRVLVFDTETTVDQYQELKFGCFRLYHKNELRQEGLITGQLSEKENSIIYQYSVDNHIKIFTAKDFIENIFIKEVYYLGTLCVGFNLPFDLSRLAIRWTEGRKHWKDGFVLILSENVFLPRLRIKSLNSKASFIEFAKPFKYQQNSSHVKGHFLDLRTIGFALTNESLSLARACDLFGIEHGKQQVEEHGKITEDYIDYNRRDVLATWEVYLKMMEEFKKHPIDLLPTKAFSPASIGKAYLKAMGIKSFQSKQPDFPKEILGRTMASYYGGRAEVKARKISVPITYLDVLSMYPSVFILQYLWKMVIADKIEIVEDTEIIRDFVDNISIDDLFKKETWLSIPALVEVLPDNDILPLRAQYEQGGDFQIGVNYLFSPTSSWYTLADVIASKLLTGKSPKIVSACRIVPTGIQKGLQAIKLRGEIDVNPCKEDFFKLLIEKRKGIQREAKTCDDHTKKAQLESLQLFLKILANSTSYGIFAEFNRNDVEKTDVEIFGTEQFTSSIESVEEPGPFANPMIATVITGAARLILAMIESLASQAGTSYAFCDTDSMAIIGKDSAIADMIVDKFKNLCPYSFGGSMLKVEDENYQKNTEIREPLYCYGISAKRYVLYNLKDGKPIIRKNSEHGLGHLLSPNRKPVKYWTSELWEYILNRNLGIDATEPEWLDLPALGQLTITRPRFIKPLTSADEEQRIRPSNFILVAFPDGQAQKIATCQMTGSFEVVCPLPRKSCSFRKSCLLFKKSRPIAPFDKNPKKWSSLLWADLATGQSLKLDFGREASNLAGRIHVKTYRDVLAEYENHREVKAAGPEGPPCEKKTSGLLLRLHINAVRKVFIGKESNHLNEVEVLGLEDDTYTVYNQGWSRVMEEMRKFTAAEFARETGISIRRIKSIRNGQERPHPRNEALIRAAIEKLVVNNLI